MRSISSAMLLVGAASVAALSACHDPYTGSAAKAASGPVVATVNGEPIGQKDVDRLAEQGAESGRPDTPESRKAILDHLTLQAVIAQEAVKEGLEKSPDVIEQLNSIRQAVLANAYVQDFMKKHPVTDDMLKAEYERIKASITGTEYKARHILVAKESEAKDIIARLKKDPSTFAALATAKSQDEGSRANGGELGWFDARRMVPEFVAAVTKLEKGKFTLEPVKTQFGYHVILLEDSRPIEAPPLEDLKPQLTEQLEQREAIKAMEALKAKAKIEIAAAPAPASPGAPAPPAAPAPSAPPAAPSK